MAPKRPRPDDADDGELTPSTSKLRLKLTLSTQSRSSTPIFSGYVSSDEDLSDDDEARELAERKQRRSSVDALSSLFERDDCKELPLKPDHHLRPLWVTPDNHIFLESFSPLYQQAYDFLIAIAEPVSRPESIHEYVLTDYSLYAAASVGLQTDDIVDVLNRLSKVVVPKSVEEKIRKYTTTYGKVKLVLRHNMYLLESTDKGILEYLLRDPTVAAARRVPGERALQAAPAPTRGDLQIAGVRPPTASATSAAPPAAPADSAAAAVAADVQQAIARLDRTAPAEDDDDDDVLGDGARVVSFEVDPARIDDLKRRCNELNYPALEEYDFRNDRANPNLEIDLKPSTVIRPYQEKSLSKMFGDGRARSGIIVLPCGAGKTLVGITAACTIKKSVLVLCTSSVSVEQWRYQFRLWTTIREEQIGRFTRATHENWRANGCESGVTISTYNMVTFPGKRSYDAQVMMDFLCSVEWGLVILDEVHVFAAETFRQVLSKVRVHCKLGLTATLLREDNKVQDLNHLIGPKLYEANWMDLSKAGHIANVQCAEVWCPMTPEFYREYLNETKRRRRLLCVMNPNKIQACQFLIRMHEERGDKIIVFCDDLFALEQYAREIIKRPFIHGKVKDHERLQIFHQFQTDPRSNCIFLSKVGDTSIDLPEATCLIQISSHFGSRRQEAQRLGRILRAKKRNQEGFNAFFYSLVSQDTDEMYYSSKRQQFLIDQGYSFKVVTPLVGMDSMPDLVYRSRREQLELLQTVLATTESQLKANDDEGRLDEDIPVARRGKAPGAVRRMGTTSALSGASGMAYAEFTTRPSGSGAGGARAGALTSNRVFQRLSGVSR